MADVVWLHLDGQSPDQATKSTARRRTFLRSQSSSERRVQRTGRLVALVDWFVMVCWVASIPHASC